MTGDQLTQLMFPQFDANASKELIARGMAASPGAAVGRIVFNNAQAESSAAAGVKCVLVRRETNPDDLPGMVAAEGVLTAVVVRPRTPQLLRVAWVRPVSVALKLLRSTPRPEPSPSQAAS